MTYIQVMKVEKSGVWGAGSALLLIMVGGVYAQEATDETVEGVFGYGEKTVEVETAQDLLEAVDQKNDITVLLKRDILVTDSEPTFTGVVHDSPCWGDSHLFNLSNYVFRTKVEKLMLDLTFAPAEGATVGKVVRNGRAEFCNLQNLSFRGIHNVTSDINGSFTPFQPVGADEMVAAASDTTSCYGYGGVFSSASGEVKGESGGVYIRDNEGAVNFLNICYDGSSMGDANCGINLKGGAIYADPEWNVEICRNGRSVGGAVNFENVSIKLDRSTEYAHSSQCYFYAYGGAIYTRDLKIDDNYVNVNFRSTGIYQTAVHNDEGYAYGGALYLSGSSSLSRNAGSVAFRDCGISVANTAKGGAIYLTDGATLVMEQNKGDVGFYGNVATAAAINGTLNDDAVAQGGAIYLGKNSTLSIRNNEGKVVFSQNAANASATQAAASVTAAGGAIWAATGSTIDISGNHSVDITANRSPMGGAIYTQGTLSICNNDFVQVYGNEGDFAVYLEGASSVLLLSAAAGHKISFCDSLYAGGKVDLNADYEGNAQQGTIEFMETTADFDGKTDLHNGTLAIRMGSRLELENLSLTTSSATLAAEGKGNSITGHVDLAEGSTLALTLNGYNATTAVLVLDGLLTMNGYYTLDIHVNGRLSPQTEYILLELEQLPYSDNAWNEQNVHVSGDVAFADLEWQNDYTKLVYRVPTVPEPTTGLLCLSALGVLISRRRRKCEMAD